MDAIKLLNERRSVGTFDPTKKIEPKVLEDIINLAVLAPSAYNLQPWRIIAVTSDEAKEKLFNAAYKQPKAKEAPVTLILVGNRNGYDTSNPVWDELYTTVGGNKEIVEGAQKGAASVYGSSDEQRTKFADSNTGLLAMSILMAAQAHGVDSHPWNGVDFAGIHKEFELAPHEDLVMLISLGYHDSSKPLNARRPRRGYNDIVTTV